MPRHSTTPAAPAEGGAIKPEIADRMVAGQDAASAAEDAARALALQIGYDGALTVGALEDEIRFYQRRSVEALLETGKRLLLLKELTPHGEFMGRCELLGFSDRTANRFMQAASKVAKSATVANLAYQVKNQKAFLELITEDDEVIEKAVANLDAIDRMSASELRAALRDVKADLQAAGERIEVKNRQLDRLEREKQRIASAPPDELIAADMQELTERGLTAVGYVRGNLRLAFRRLFDLEREGAAPAGAHRRVMAGWVGELENELQALKSEFFLDDVQPVNVRADLDALVAQSAVGAEAANAA